MMVVVVVVSNHDATDATREEVLSLSPLHVPSFGLVQVVYVQVFLFFFFPRHGLLSHSRGPGNNLWRLLGRGSGRVAAGG